MTWPTIDHSFLSPSGHVSKRAEKISKEWTRRLLFGDGLKAEPIQQPSECETLLRQATELRSLAARGMKPRAYLKRALELEEKAIAKAEGR